MSISVLLQCFGWPADPLVRPSNCQRTQPIHRFLMEWEIVPCPLGSRGQRCLPPSPCTVLVGLVLRQPGPRIPSFQEFIGHCLLLASLGWPATMIGYRVPAIFAGPCLGAESGRPANEFCDLAAALAFLCFNICHLTFSLSDCLKLWTIDDLRVQIDRQRIRSPASPKHGRFLRTGRRP